MGIAHPSAYQLSGVMVCLECLPHVIETNVLAPMAAEPAQGGSSIDELATACNVVFVSKASPGERTAKFVDAVREQLQA
eukprot:5076101-Prymnesium_polylepis.1